jgi:hypothetical protein
VKSSGTISIALGHAEGISFHLADAGVRHR